MIEITEYSPQYFSGLKALLTAVYDSNISQEDLETKYVTQEKKILIALDNSDVKGCLFMEIKEDFVRPSKTAFITYVAVDPNARRQGIATKLFKEAEEQALKQGCTAIELTSANFREEAHKFYENIGFTKKKTTVFIKDQFDR